MRQFDIALMVPAEDIEFHLRGRGSVPWADFVLNPRRLRGSDFLMRWSQGRWSEDMLIKAVEESGTYFALPYGPSSTAPDEPKAFELYFERLEKAGTDGFKRPDLLVFKTADRVTVDECLTVLGGVAELPFTREDHPAMVKLIGLAVVAVECENSLWKAKQMPDYGRSLTPQKRLGGKNGVKKTAILPTVIIKEQDRKPLRDWQAKHGIPIHVWHVFFDLAFGLSLDDAERLVNDGYVLGITQVYQAPNGVTTEKVIFKFPYLHAYELGETVQEPKLIGKYVEDKNGHILPYVHFDGGRLKLLPKALEVLDEVSNA